MAFVAFVAFEVFEAVTFCFFAFVEDVVELDFLPVFLELLVSSSRFLFLAIFFRALAALATLASLTASSSASFFRFFLRFSFLSFFLFFFFSLCRSLHFLCCLALGFFVDSPQIQQVPRGTEVLFSSSESESDMFGKIGTRAIERDNLELCDPRTVVRLEHVADLEAAVFDGALGRGESGVWWISFSVVLSYSRVVDLVEARMSQKV